MSYVVLARKWRPMSFDDLIGQSHVSRTLANAISSDRVAHAFLFTGVRGVGKTTSARILAKALNCMRPPGSIPSGEDPGPTATPCLKCDACLEITQGTDVDVREIDGASYNGVDEVRKLQDSLPYRPARDRYKIFIVDEVHMLSQNAWNAFLKTLEEPPPHVKFIFATTEVHKVPITILSRVQRFDFKLIPAGQIAERIRYVLDKENISADDSAISLIAREAAGSMRDAMSLLDQVIAWGGDRLDGEGIARVLGVASRKVLHDVIRALVQGNPVRCLEVVSELADQGFDMAHTARNLLSLLRDLVVAKVCENPDELLDLADEEQRDLINLAAESDTDDVIRLHQGFSQNVDEIMRGGQPKAGLEMLLVRLARRPPLIPIDDLIERLVSLESRIGSGASDSPTKPRAPRRGPSPEVSRAQSSTGAPPQRSRSREPRSPNSSPARSVDNHEDPPPAPIEAPPAPTKILPPEQDTSERVSSNSTSHPAPRSIPAAEQPGEASPPALDDWRTIVELVRDSRPELAAFFQHAAPISVTASQIVLGFERGSVFQRQASSKEAQEVLLTAAQQHFGQRPELRLDLNALASQKVDTVAEIEARLRVDRKKEAIQRAKTHPRVTEAIEILGARIKEVRVPEE